MKPSIKFCALICLFLVQIALGESQQVRQYPLDEYRVFEIDVSCDRVTTVSFPGPIEAIDAANVTIDGRARACFKSRT